MTKQGKTSRRKLAAQAREAERKAGGPPAVSKYGAKLAAERAAMKPAKRAPGMTHGEA